MSVGKWISVGLIVVGVTLFLIFGGTEGQISGIVAGIVAVIAAGSVLVNLIKGLITKKS